MFISILKIQKIIISLITFIHYQMKNRGENNYKELLWTKGNL